MKKLLILGELEEDVSHLEKNITLFIEVEVEKYIDFTEALSALQSRKFDYIITDCCLAETGRIDLQLYPLFKAYQPQARILVRTRYASQAGAVAAFKSGAIGEYFSAEARDGQKCAEMLRWDWNKPREKADLNWTAQKLVWEYINDVYYYCGGNMSQTSRVLNIHRRTLQRKIHKYAPAAYTRYRPKGYTGKKLAQYMLKAQLSGVAERWGENDTGR